jgi:hypothetical protein
MAAEFRSHPISNFHHGLLALIIVRAAGVVTHRGQALLANAQDRPTARTPGRGLSIVGSCLRQCSPFPVIEFMESLCSRTLEHLQDARPGLVVVRR